jgi:hypothetical protein
MPKANKATKPVKMIQLAGDGEQPDHIANAVKGDAGASASASHGMAGHAATADGDDSGSFFE